MPPVEFDSYWFSPNELQRCKVDAVETLMRARMDRLDVLHPSDDDDLSGLEQCTPTGLARKRQIVRGSIESVVMEQRELRRTKAGTMNDIHRAVVLSAIVYREFSIEASEDAWARALQMQLDVEEDDDRGDQAPHRRGATATDMEVSPTSLFVEEFKSNSSNSGGESSHGDSDHSLSFSHGIHGDGDDMLVSPYPSHPIPSHPVDSIRSGPIRSDLWMMAGL